MVEERSTQNDKSCHDVGEIEDKEVVEDGLG